ncbi:MAG: HAMP domain-containing histidine kinase [Gemmatimonadota bacterium]|nr:HAMP domain-containing histidine kinase [Gemmatimonadota bacterium]
MPSHLAARAPRTALPVVLLLLVLVLVVALAYKALQSDRSHRAGALRTLQDYAEFATWEYGIRAQRSLLTAIGPMFASTMVRINPDLPSDSLPAIGYFARAASDRGRYCNCTDGVQFFFRYDWREGGWLTAGEAPTPGIERWARDTVIAHPRIFPKPEGLAPLAYGGTSVGGALRRLSVLITNDSYVLAVNHIEGRDYAVVYVLSRDIDGEPVATYGFVTEAKPFFEQVLGTAVKREQLLPPALLRGVPSDSAVLALGVQDLAGHHLYRSAARFPATYAALDTLDQTFGRIVVGVALRPEFAGRLVVGGLPPSQLPILAGLVLLTAALVAGAVYQLRKQQELARLRTDFVSGVSHELRTPLTQIRLFAELLRNKALRSEEERERALRVVDQEARRLTYLVENVLDFSRGERRLNRVMRERFDVAAAVRDTLDFFSPVAQARGAKLRADVPEHLVAAVDASALRQILLNLVDNAVKYGPAGQTVTVAISELEGMLRLRVDDQGPGIPDAEADRIWEPYHRLTREAESAIGGSGIGLAVVRELAELHGGGAWAERAPHASGVPGGARFVVHLATDGEAAGRGPFKTGEWSEDDFSPEGESSGAPQRGAPPNETMAPSDLLGGIDSTRGVSR